MAASNLNASVADLYKCLKKHTLTYNERCQFGYPFRNSSGSVSIIKQSPSLSISIADLEALNTHRREEGDNEIEEVCIRCRKTFSITNTGEYIDTNNCHYHEPYERVTGTYPCPNRELLSRACCGSKLHVWSGLRDGLNNFNNFVEIPMPTESPQDGYLRICAVCCEMCYTTAGMELLQVSVVKVDGTLGYNAFVTHENETIDYNTKYSGITARDFRNIKNKKSLAEVHNDLQKLINRETVLIGHGLENSLRALKILHENVIDTSIEYSHCRGLSLRRSLKDLITEVLESQVKKPLTNGQKSKENAKHVMNLMLRKIEGELKN